jgi:CO dehydrogenase/acetyl-CoA synthase delta subunit
MFKKLKKRLAHWLMNENLESANLVKIQDISIDSDGLRFRIMQADGGHIVEISSYDSVRDRSNVQLHIITSDQDFSQRLGHIVTMEVLRNS